jgi:hypothetical protein
MPSAKVYASPNVSELDDATRESISIILQKVIADALGIDRAHVEILWIPVVYAYNEVHLGVEITFSVRSGLIAPTDEQLAEMARMVRKELEETELLPEDFDEVSGWSLPQYKAHFSLGKRGKGKGKN